METSGYLGNKVLIARVVGGDDGEDVPVVLLHDVEHDRGLLLNGWAELEKHGVVILRGKDKDSKVGWLKIYCISHETNHISLWVRKQKCIFFLRAAG